MQPPWGLHKIRENNNHYIFQFLNRLNICLSPRGDKQLFNPPMGCTKTFQMDKIQNPSYSYITVYPHGGINNCLTPPWDAQKCFRWKKYKNHAFCPRMSILSTMAHCMNFPELYEYFLFQKFLKYV